MNRVELKESKHPAVLNSDRVFLMNRVELKVLHSRNTQSPPLYLFLMNRVELKGNLNILIPAGSIRS